MNDTVDRLLMPGMSNLDMETLRDHDHFGNTAPA
jgi:hypothetical protein